MFDVYKSLYDVEAFLCSPENQEDLGVTRLHTSRDHRNGDEVIA